MADDGFAEAVKRLPPPITDFSDGAACPWCGALHRTVTYGQNQCDECRRGFLFGHPAWAGSKECFTWVDFPWTEYYALGRRPELIEQWVPNERMKALHFQKAEEALGTDADRSNPQ